MRNIRAPGRESIDSGSTTNIRGPSLALPMFPYALHRGLQGVMIGKVKWKSAVQGGDNPTPDSKNTTGGGEHTIKTTKYPNSYSDSHFYPYCYPFGPPVSRLPSSRVHLNENLRPPYSPYSSSLPSSVLFSCSPRGKFPNCHNEYSGILLLITQDLYPTSFLSHMLVVFRVLIPQSSLKLSNVSTSQTKTGN